MYVHNAAAANGRPPQEFPSFEGRSRGPGICASKLFRFICAVVFLGLAASATVILMNLGSSSDATSELVGLPCDDAFEPSIDPHVNALVDSIVADGGTTTDVKEWAGQNLWAEEYVGMMRSPGGVLAGRNGG